MNKQNSTAMNWAVDFTKNIKQPSHLSYLPLFLVKRFIKVYITYRLFIPLKKKMRSTAFLRNQQRISDSNGCDYVNQTSFKLIALNRSANSLLSICFIC